MRKTVALMAILALAVSAARQGAAAAPTQSAPAADVQSVAVEGTEFVVTLSDGKVMRSADLAGAVLTIATSTGPLRLRIDAVEPDPDSKGGPAWLHTFSTLEADGAWRNLCSTGPDGRQQGFPLAFRPREPDGAMEPAPPEIFELICTSGARGKCVRFGYPPWKDAGMLSLYNACVRMVRADYCGEGESTTRNGMRIDLYDDRAIQTPDNDPAQEFEAGWTEAGASCVRHVRVKEHTSLDALAASCPRLRRHLGSSCTEEGARALGAILFNRSTP